MQIVDMNSKKQWDKVVLHLSKSEAAELRDAIEEILMESKPGRHEHVSNHDFTKEITVVIESS